MAINPMLLMSLLQTAPTLVSKAMAATKGINPLEPPHAIGSALEAGYDPGLMNDALEGGESLEHLTKRMRWDLTPMTRPNANMFPSDFTGDPSLVNLFKQLTLDQQRMIGGAPASLSAATFGANPIQMQDWQIPNPATGMSEEDWAMDDVDDEDNPVKRAWLIEQFRKKYNK